MQAGDQRRFSVLGPVRAWLGPDELELGPPQQRAVLAVLLLNAGRHVPAHLLVDSVWGANPPASAAQAIRMYISRLRRILPAREGMGAKVIESSAAGYRLPVADDELDLAVFRAHLEAARTASDPTGKQEALRQGLALWRGDPLAGLPLEQLHDLRRGLAALRLDARATLLSIEVDHGPVGPAAVELAGLVAEHPMDERFVRLLMLALYRSGRQAAALSTYQGARRRLSEELGVEPGGPLQELHLQILRADSRLLVPDEDEATGRTPEQLPRSAKAPVPAQLSSTMADFTGRTTELAHLEAYLPGSGPGAGDLTTAALILIHGMAGTGKTSLAVHWANRIAHRFPDGQLQVNLRGFDADGSAMTPAEALRRLFDGLGVAPEQIPVALEAQSALLRTVLAGRRVLILLDNARGAEQVRPLLPGAQGCLVIVTSRHQLRSLVALDQAQPLALGVMPHAQAREFLLRRIGVQRAGGDRSRDAADDVDAIAGLCGGLPLALSIVASRVVLEPETSLAGVVAELRAAAGTLEAFSDIDEAMDLRAIFSWSYRQLDPDTARLFRLLAQHPGPDTAVAVVASTADLPVRRTRILADDLVRAHLVREQPAGRYVMHDLVRAYASELSSATDSELERRAALERMLDHYLHWARAACVILRPQYPVDVPVTLPSVPADLTDEASARDWFTTEHHAMLSAAEIAAGGGFDPRVCQLATLMNDLLRRYGYWPSVLKIQTLALGAGERLGDQQVQAQAHRGLGQAYARLGLTGQAEASLERALVLFGELNDDRGQCSTYAALAFLHGSRGDYLKALGNSERSLDHARATGNTNIVANALNDYGWCLALNGDYQGALENCRQSLALCQELGLKDAQASTWDSLGFIHARLNDHRQAADCYEQSESLFRELGDRFNESGSLVHLGDCYRMLGLDDQASAVWHRAHAILVDLRDPEAEQVQQLLDRIVTSS